jgi:hypothetical protein
MTRATYNYLFCAMASACIFYLPNNVFAGSAPGNLTCTPLTQGSDMHIEGTVPASEPDFDLEISSRGSKYTLSSEDTEAITIGSFDDKVYMLYLRSKAGEELLSLYAIPSTFTIKKSRPYSISASFTAVLTAIRPSKWTKQSKTYEDYVHKLKLLCSYSYAI